MGDGELVLADEVLTPDSSRFWDAATYAPGGPQPSFDKQYVRDWLERQPWDKTDPGPALPDDVVAGTRARYVEAFERITGASFARYLDEDVIAPADAEIDEPAGSGSPSTSRRRPGSSIRRAGRSRRASVTSGSRACRRSGSGAGSS